MINILLPAMGKSTFFKNYYFPKLMLEINGETILESVINNFNNVNDKHYIFVLSEEECVKYHIDNSARIASGEDDNNSILILKNQTAGALCTCLLCTEKINNDTPLIISNFDQIIDVDFNDVIEYFNSNDFDAGVVSFPSIHPRWSYVRTHGEEVVEVAEKRPISKHAVAGFYYFKNGADFVEAAKKTILKSENLDGQYYISSSLNEMILDNKRVGYYEIDKDKYHSFYSPEKIKEYEKIRG